MSRSLKSAVLLLLLVLVPLRGLAAASIGVCALEQVETLTQNDAPHDYGAYDSGRAHHHDGSADGEHCGNAFFAASPAPVLLACPLSSERIVSAERFAAGFVADYLDPPPLAR